MKHKHSQPLEDLINEVRVLYQTLVQVGDKLHENVGISMGMRAVLEYLEREGDTTVPDIARARAVTRQRIQTLANDLMEKALVVTVANPASQRSPLLTLTDEGAVCIRDMRRREAKLLNDTITDQEAKAARRTLNQLRQNLKI